MNAHPRVLRALLFAALLCPLAALPAFADDPANAADGPTPTPTTTLHEIGATPATVTAPDPDNGLGRHHHHGNGDDRVSVFGSVRVTSDEDVQGSAVAVFGNVTVDGNVSGDAVAVLGSTTINGWVHGDAVAVLGNLSLGPHARVDGDVVCVGGTEIRDAGAVIGGKEVHRGLNVDGTDSPEFSGWLHHGLAHGHVFLPLVHHSAFWISALCLLAFYVLIALAFPGGIAKCGDALTHRPGLTFLTGILSILALPFLFILLFATLVGIPVAVIVLPLAVVAAVLFGKAAIYSLVGRSILGTSRPVAVTTLLGAVLFMVLYFVPFLGAMLWILIGFLGFSCALTALFTSKNPAAPAGPPPAVPLAPPPTPAVPPVVAATPAAGEPGRAPLEIPAIPAVAAAAAFSGPPPAISEAGLPRAGFWIRMVALLVDFILIAIVTQAKSWLPAALAVYGAILWKLKGATIGDIIFHLKVVRLDGNPSDWMTMIVRALACFFSLIVLGLGFIWIAFDREKQGWHDKIAGTVVVKLPRGSSLV